ncbi:uncharacterized protein LOC117235629 [Bombus vosnesenskii]|uniref:Uncharacterized protein LOC117235629 n=1 Tax=Bombus vosnesenskii TaxID=207650 RepID=A0A6J3KKM8_9HYME|nr:uncharacterized protein LOC117235629 [Bombus vosnesenskii]
MPSITWARRDTKTKMRAKARQLRGQNVNNDSVGRRPYLEYRCHSIQFLCHLGHRTVVRLYRHYYLEWSNDTCVVGDGLRLSEIPNREYDFPRSMILDASRCFTMLHDAFRHEDDSRCTVATPHGQRKKNRPVEIERT